MFINANSLTSDMHTDFCIIGSGVGGSTVTKELFDNKKNFILIEAGELEGNSSNIRSTNSGQPFDMPLTRSIGLGGTTNVWGGGLTPLDKIDFDAVDEFGKKRWPFTYNNLLPSYMKAAKLFGISDLNFFEADSLSLKRKNQLDHLPVNRNVLGNKIFQIPLPLFRFKPMLETIFSNSSLNHCIYNAPALELKHSDGQVTSLIIGTSTGLRTITADKFIVCAGALETPRLLLNSGIINSNIGRYLMDHPKGYLCQIKMPDNPLPKDHIFAVMKYYDNNDLQVKAGYTLKKDFLELNNVLNHNVYLKPIYGDLSTMKRIEKLGVIVHTLRGSKSKIKDILHLLSNFGDLLRGVGYKYDLNQRYDIAGLFVVAEQSPSKKSYVSLAEKEDQWGYRVANTHWHIEESDYQDINRLLTILKENLGLPETAFCQGMIDDSEDFRSTISSAAHHLGTARISTSKEQGVVDSQLKVFGFKNLYVCDASVFPSAGNANPSLTISALAYHAMNHLLEAQ